MIKEYINSTLQNKNSVMFITSMCFMAGILSCFNHCELFLAGFLTVIGVAFILTGKLSVKYVLFWLFIFYFGFFNAYFRIKNYDDLSKISPQNAVITGQIASIPDSSSKDKLKFFFDVKTVNNKVLQGKTLVTVSNSEVQNTEKYTIGNNLEINAKIRLPFKAGNPSQFDYGSYLKNFNTFTTSYAEDTECKLLNSNAGFYESFMQKLNKVRNNIIYTHSKYLKSPNIEILGGIVFGDDAVAPPEYIKTTFINSGLLHILAASGMNVAFIFGFWFFIMRFFKIPYKINVTGGIIMVILYTLMTGLGPSVLRASLMLLFIQIGKLIDRDAHSVSLLSFVAFLLLLYNPAFINNVGFQLSFIVTFGLLTTGMVCFNKLKNLHIPDWLKGGIIIPVIAQLWAAPIQMFYFNTFSTYSIPANIVTIPLLSIVSFGGFVSSILATVQPISDFVCKSFDFVLQYALDGIVYISNFFASLPHSIIWTPHPSILQIIIYYATIMILTLLIEIGLNKKLIISLIITIFLLPILSITIPNKNLEIITFDVGNADAFLIKTPKNKYFIIDTAKLSYKSTTSTAKMVIIKYLKDRKINEIEGLILTHFDLDHAGGASDIMNSIRIKNIYVNSLRRENITITNIFNTMEKNNLKPTLVKDIQNIYSENDLNINLYTSGLQKDDNENSIVTLLNYKNFNMLFMGDAGVPAFNKIKTNLPSNIEILKVGHHGGRGVVDKNMLNRLNNEVSIISTGINTFGHPAKSTLDTLKNTHTYRTDKHNSIKITTDGEDFSIYTFNRTDKKYRKAETLKSK